MAQARGPFTHSPMEKAILGWWEAWLFLQWCGLKAFSHSLELLYGQHTFVTDTPFSPEKLSWSIQRQPLKAKTLNPKPPCCLFFPTNTLRGLNLCCSDAGFQAMAELPGPIACACSASMLTGTHILQHACSSVLQPTRS